MQGGGVDDNDVAKLHRIPVFKGHRCFSPGKVLEISVTLTARVAAGPGRWSRE